MNFFNISINNLVWWLMFAWVMFGSPMVLHSQITSTGGGGIGSPADPVGFSCVGAIEISSFGESGPFTVRVEDNNEAVITDGAGNRLEDIIINADDIKTFDGICAGTYTIVHVNRFGCPFTEEVDVISCTDASCCDDLNVTIENRITENQLVNCSRGECNLTLSASTSEVGIPVVGRSIEFTWSNGETGRQITNLCSGDYSVTATDNNGCSSNASFKLCCIGIRIEEIINASGVEGGTVSFELLHDEPITRLSLDGIDIDQNLRFVGDLEPGNHTLFFETESGCSVSKRFSITSCDDIELGDDTSETLPATSPDCSARINVSMPNPSRFTYLWQDGRVNRSRTLYCDIQYSVTITDKLGCGEVVRKFEVCQDNASETLVASACVSTDDCTARISKYIGEGTGGGYTIIWNDGFEQHNQSFLRRQNLCVNQTYNLLLIDSENCSSFKIIDVVNSGFTEGSGSRTLELGTINVPFEGSVPSVNFEFYGENISNALYRNLTDQTPARRVQVQEVTENNYSLGNEFDFGNHSAEIETVTECRPTINFSVKQCYSPSMSVEASLEGNINGSARPMIKTEVIFTDENFTPETNGSTLTFSLLDENDLVVEQNTTGIFNLSRSGMFIVRVEDPCGGMWESESVATFDCGEDDGRRIQLNIRDQCGDRSFTRTWVQVVSFIAPKTSLFEVNDELDMRISYSGPSNDLPFSGRVQIWNIRDWDGDHRFNEYMLATDFDRDDSERFHITIDDDDPNGLLRVSLISDRGCSFRRADQFGRNYVNMPLVTSPNGSVHTDQTIIAEREDRDRGIFTGPYWFGFMQCSMCLMDYDNLFFGTRSSFTENLCRNNRNHNVNLFDNYKPNDIDRPCTGGGKIEVPPSILPRLIQHRPTITIEPNYFSEYFKRGSKCGCLFPPSAVKGSAAEMLQGLNMSPLYVEYSCESDGTIEEPDIDQEVIDDLCDKYEQCDDCEIELTDCRANLICFATGDTLERDVNLEPGQTIDPTCWVIFQEDPNSDLYTLLVGEPCSIDPCNRLSWTEVGPNLINEPITLIGQYTATTPHPPCENMNSCDFSSGGWNIIGKDIVITEDKIYSGDDTGESIFVINVYPNPNSVNSKLTIKSSIDLTDITLVSSLGKKVLEIDAKRNQTVIEVMLPNSITAGVYFVRARSRSGKITHSQIIIR